MTTTEVLTPDQRAQVHERTLRVLSTVGMRVDSDEGRDLLAEAGALVDQSTRIVRIPPSLVEQSLAAAPREFSLGGRRPDWSVPLNAGESTLCLDGGPTMVLDRRSGERRPSTYDDWCEATVLCDALDEIGLFWSPVEGGRRDDSMAGWVDYIIDTQRRCSKHVQDSFDDPAEAPWLLETLEVIFGGRDEVRRRHPYSFLITPVSPLIMERHETDAWLALRGYDIPVAAMPMPLMGATAPGSMLATVLLGNCETLGALCLIQSAESGTPFIYAPCLASVDPRNGRLAGNAGQTAMSVAGIEMARFYGLPAMGSGPGTDHFEPGTQAGYEKAFDTLFSALAWPDILVGPGTLAEASVFSFEQTIVDIEIWRLCRKAHAGIVVDEDRWLDDVIERVGPGGHFLGERSTRANARRGEWHLPQLGRNDSYEAWAAAGRPDVLDEAREVVDTLLATHEPLPLGAETEGELARVRDRARAVS